MQSLQCSEHYTDKGQYAVMTRTRILNHAQLTRIADHLCRNAEELLFSTDQPTIDDCRTAGMILGLAYNLVPMRIGTTFDY